MSEAVEFDFCVVGGGIAGLCASLAAARRGMRVGLIHNRSVLGGNASSEIRQTIGGASFMGHYPDSREGGLVDELWSAIRGKCLGGNVNDYAESSVVLLEACWKEPNLRLFLNTHVTDVRKEGRRLVEVGGFQMTTGARHVVRARQFADCTGDAGVSHLAGCAYMTGQEARSAFGESLAPEAANGLTMGNTILFQTEKLDRDVPFVRPEWAPDLSTLDCYWTLHPPKTPMPFGSWVFEYGGQLDTIADAEKIHEELYRILYAAWADLKGRPELGMGPYRISFVSALPGKRESRRVIGDYVLNQNDIVETRRFGDDVAYAGWALDLHNPEGFYGKDRPTTFYFFPDLHSIPLRSLYARDVDNLWLAGRNISVTHIALGGARLMASCGLAGEAVGIAAAEGRGMPCREAALTRAKAIQQEILKGGGFIPGVRNEDPLDLARRAEVTASSEACLEAGAIESFDPIGAGMGIALPIVSGRLDRLRLTARNAAGTAVPVRAVLQGIRVPRDFHPTSALQTAVAMAAPGEGVLDFAFHAELKKDLWMVHFFSEDPSLLIAQTTARLTGVHAADHHPQGHVEDWCHEVGMPDPPLWVRRFNRGRMNQPERFHPTPCFEIEPVQKPYGAREVLSGINRPERLPNMWMSSPGAAFPHGMALEWKAPVMLREVRILFDGDMDLAMPPVEPVSTLVSHYKIVAKRAEGGDVVLAVNERNASRMAVHRFDPVLVSSISLEIHAMHGGGTQARVCEIRCY